MTRRQFLQTLAALSLAAPAFAAKSPSVRVSGPAVAETLPLLAMGRAGPLPGIARTVVFTPWNSPDQLRAMIATDDVDAALMTTASACTLANKGVPATVVALTSSPVWLVSSDAALSRLSGLDGREVLLPFGPGEMPDLLLRALAGRAGVSFVPRHAGNALEAVNLLLLGQGHCALLSEPAASLAVSRANARPRPGVPVLAKRLDVRDAWRKVFPEHPQLAQSALAVIGPLARDAATCKVLQTAYVQATGWLAAHPQETTTLAGKDFPALASQAVNGVLPGQDIRLVMGRQGAQDARFFLSLLHGMSPASIGGQLPESSFFEVDA
ncbi:ABC-type nitrate/sulfonate/bicarbonate transport systems periplasmic components-like protein [Solidesulfovibrio fructosivorans JJ]]|uniref:ABC-type nitrate/sulfonate/bicarbonate transport systems periplasmic components-like protein n=1 Tax=Solidesulfovibrio fructosivorans JJ] TaxID=596151 RepID=E1JTH0_SOLFR|nr:ABC transporter substrate-binding protein [Solidesulfovibrio fructosivorans]EFL52430.1 ABC-type nitrate/sulfonate/bicarbonate transport systems periplasmic components-like protein [Solidesulfovibrio fructosivorans JJ]]